MPFKTKKRKVGSSKRRVSISEIGLASYSSSSTAPISEVEPIRQKVKPTEMISKNYSYIKGEVYKIALLALLIIGLQLFLKISNIIS